jgi:hypothetical protein
MIYKILVTTMLFLNLLGIAHTETIIYYFSGELDEPFGSLTEGTLFSGSFSYEDSQPLNTPNKPYRGDYSFTSVSLTINGLTLTNNGTGYREFFVFDHGVPGSYPPRYWDGGGTTGYPTDSFHLYTSFSGTFGGLTIEAIWLVLTDLSGNVFTDPSLPGGNLVINDFTIGNGTFLNLIEQYSPEQVYGPANVRGELSYFSATPVATPIPEPTTFLLFGFGLLGITGVTRKRINIEF